MKRAYELLKVQLCILALNIQRFANPNTNVTTDSDLSGEMKTYYHDTLIDNAEPYLVHDQFGEEINIPPHHGKTIELRKFDVLAKNTNALTEGVTPDGKKLKMGVINATISQYGDYITMSDVINTTAIDPILVQATKAMGSQAGRSLDTITRDVVCAGTNVLYADKYVDDVRTAVNSRAGLDATAKLDADIFYRAQAELEAMLADPIGDSYVAIIHPYAAYDIQRDPDFVEMHKYADAVTLYKGELGMIGNIRFVKSTEAKIVKQGDNFIFLTMVIGKGAYATSKATGLGLEHIVKPLGAGEDPLNQRCTAGWKATKVALRVKEQNMVRIESMGTFSSKITEVN